MVPTEPVLTLPGGTALDTDPDVYDAMKKLALHTVDCAIDILDTAAPAQQLVMIRILLPGLARALKTAPEDDKGELRDGVTAIYDMVRRELEPPAHPQTPQDDGDTGSREEEGT